MSTQRARPAVGALRGLTALRAAVVGPCALAATAAAAAPMATALAAPAAAQHCTLLLNAHRSGQLLQALPLPPGRTTLQIAFVHSVLGTPVIDHYQFRPGPAGQWQAHLVAEQFEGEGYGLPYAAGPGEQLVREGAGWRLTLDRVVDPLVVLPLPSQRMRLLLPGRTPLLLGDLSAQSLRFTLAACAAGD